MAPFGDGTTVEVDNVVRLTARAGYGFGDGLVYARGGAGWIKGAVTAAGDRATASDWAGWQTQAPSPHPAADHRRRRGPLPPSLGFDDLDLDVDVWTVQARVTTASDSAAAPPRRSPAGPAGGAPFGRAETGHSAATG